MVGGQERKVKNLYHITSLSMYFIGQTVEYNKSYTPVIYVYNNRIVYTKLSDSLCCYATLINGLYCVMQL